MDMAKTAAIAVATIIFNLLAFAVFSFIRWNFKGVIPNSNYDWGMAQYVCYIGIIIVAAGAVALLIVKRKNNKKHKTLE